jgi:hypothetical protein
MILSARFLDNYVDVNTFDIAPQVTVTTSYPPVAGQTVTLYLQLVDLSKDKASQGFYPNGRRYVSPVGSTLQIMLTSINQANNCTLYGTAVALDRSIWQLVVPEADLGKFKRGTWNLVGNLQESANKIIRFAVPAAISVLPQSDY